MTSTTGKRSNDDWQLIKFQKDLAMLERLHTPGRDLKKMELHMSTQRKGIDISELLNPKTPGGGTQFESPR
jgi:hypothetical protein